MTTPTGREWILPNLKEAVSLLAADAATQLAHLEGIGGAPVDELALEFDDAMHLLAELMDSGLVGPRAATALRVLESQILAMSELEDPDLWHGEFLASRGEWQQVRVLAASALELLEHPREFDS